MSINEKLKLYLKVMELLHYLILLIVNIIFIYLINIVKTVVLIYIYKTCYFT